MNFRVKVSIVISICLLGIIISIFMSWSNPEAIEIVTADYQITNDYFLDNNMVQGLWGFNAISYNSYVQKTISQNEKIGNIKVAILDTGIDHSHPDLVDNIITGYDFVNDDDNPNDDNGHGTQIAGIIGGKYTGTAYGVKLMPVKVLDQRGLGKSETLIKGIMWAVDNGANVINLSIGRKRHESLGISISGEDSFNDLEYKAIKYALLNNVAVITVSGDNNVSEVGYPAAYKYTDLKDQPIIVTGVNQDMEKASMANYSEELDISSPGEYILSTTPRYLDINDNEYLNISDDGYIYCQGTSYAAAFVTGLACVIKSYNPSYNNKDIRKLIIAKSKDIGAKGFDNITGYGIVNFDSILKYLEK